MLILSHDHVYLLEINKFNLIDQYGYELLQVPYLFDLIFLKIILFIFHINLFLSEEYRFLNVILL